MRRRSQVRLVRSEPPTQLDRRRHLVGRQRLVRQIGPQRHSHLQRCRGDLRIDPPPCSPLAKQKAIGEGGTIHQLRSAAQHPAGRRQRNIPGVEAPPVRGQRAGAIQTGQRQAGVDQVDDPLTVVAVAALQEPGHNVVVEKHRGRPEPRRHVPTLHPDVVDRHRPFAGDEFAFARPQVVDRLGLQRLPVIDPHMPQSEAPDVQPQRRGVLPGCLGEFRQRHVERRPVHFASRAVTLQQFAGKRKALPPSDIRRREHKTFRVPS